MFINVETCFLHPGWTYFQRLYFTGEFFIATNAINASSSVTDCDLDDLVLRILIFPVVVTVDADDDGGDVFFCLLVV